uniref:trypsin n=1 Tax=Gasterosteus aculeatus aculeatus TaxID=481459 RepID=G3PI05_GASAC
MLASKHTNSDGRHQDSDEDGSSTWPDVTSKSAAPVRNGADVVSDARHCCSAAHLDSDLNMLARRELLTLTLALTLAGRGDAGGIVGGHEAAPHTRPYMALLELHMHNGQHRRCGGFLLSEDFVMTAAHCRAKSHKVFLGVHDVHGKGIQVLSVAQTFQHQDYNATDFRNDMMLLKLSSKAIFNKNVAPIALADEGNVSWPKTCLVSGWGKTETGKNSVVSSKLMEVKVKLISFRPCDESNFYCSEGEKGPIQGDSGGPLVCEDGKAYGVFSNVFEPKSKDPAIYCFVKIPLYRTWIDGTMKKARGGSGSRDG